MGILLYARYEFQDNQESRHSVSALGTDFEEYIVFDVRSQPCTMAWRGDY